MSSEEKRKCDTSDDIHFTNSGDLRTKAEGLATDASIGESSSHCQVQVISPRERCKSMLESGVKNIDPKLLPSDISVVKVTNRRVHRVAHPYPHPTAPLSEPCHVHHHAATCHRLPPRGVPLSPRRHLEGDSLPVRRLEQPCDVLRRRRVEDRQWDFPSYVAVVLRSSSLKSFRVSSELVKDILVYSGKLGR